MIQLNRKSSDIQTIIDYAINANKSAAEQKQIQIKINIENELTNVFADAEKTSWVLNNLLSNAIRYSYENSEIKIDVRNENEKIRFSVKDFGRGIEEQYLDKIFDQYFRIPGTKKEGTGLGLSISKQFIELQGGEISVTSNFGLGSEFIFYLEKYHN
ncbi:Sensor protein ZraS [compost metagenome]